MLKTVITVMHFILIWWE